MNTPTRRTPLSSTRLLAAALALDGLALAGCTTTPPNAPPPASSSANSSQARLDAAVDGTLARLYQVVPGTREMVARSAGVLVFPEVIGGALIVGAEHGRGALRVGGRTAGYYSTTGASIGWQVGGQSKAVVYVFSTREALQKFQDAQNQLGGALGRLIAVSESYPDLKSNQNFLALQSQLEGTENRLTVARRLANPVSS